MRRAAASVIGRLNPRETYAMQQIRRMHCAQEKGSHDCVGRVTIDPGGVTLQCARCGDCRQNNADHEESLDPAGSNR